ncbi:hypothetical protein Q4S45_03450 [Massilia sp. R2A-15]|uniref:hypothetical protein n=1 Tax=Massilia sp. R2A-15 TaxID=3064278 RepID=UPI0027338CC2|nr:hypothetical protein [Massilia sp. R2A-15]WLI90193.1 hypothetical protein Q4S45_03450 [Massilia sp. R2A-15]
MSAQKHMETIFAVVVVAGCVVAALPDSTARPAPRETVANARMPVVVIKAKRMTAREKRQSAVMDATAGAAAAKGT